MKNFNVKFIIYYENYSGYDHKMYFDYVVLARNFKSAKK